MSRDECGARCDELLRMHIIKFYLDSSLEQRPNLRMKGQEKKPSSDSSLGVYIDPTEDHRFKKRRAVHRFGR